MSLLDTYQLELANKRCGQLWWWQLAWLKAAGSSRFMMMQLSGYLPFI